MKEGERVRIGTLENWAMGAAARLEGLLGTVTEIKTIDDHWAMPERNILVKLDVAPEPWWTYQQPSREWWFKESELEGK